MRLILLADIHANLSALTAVLNDAGQYTGGHFILLGDLIDYCMRPNEVIAALRALPLPCDVSIWGNHEKAIIDGELERFSSERGRKFSRYTRALLDDNSFLYINTMMKKSGREEKIYGNKRFLFIHGSLEDIFWKAVTPNMQNNCYAEYDYVVSAHSHLPFCFEYFFESSNTETRGKKKTVFINPGSVGQPRNHNPCAQYAVLDTDTGAVFLNAVPYDIAAEQKLYGDNVDEFYKNRLSRGI